MTKLGKESTVYDKELRYLTIQWVLMKPLQKPKDLNWGGGNGKSFEQAVH